MTKKIAIVNQKGGVGKTTTAINLATAFVAVGKTVLLIDLDPQGNSCTGLGVSYRDRGCNIYKVLIEGLSIESSIIITEIPNLSIIPSTVDLSAAEIELHKASEKEYVLKKSLEKLGHYDYILIDCPPSLGLLTVNALTACSGVIIPLQCEFFALDGLRHLLKTTNLVKKRLNERLEIEGILLTMFDKRNKLSEQVEEDIRSYLGEKVYKTIIPRNVKLAEAQSYGKPVLFYDMNCSGAAAYIDLAREILMKENVTTN